MTTINFATATKAELLAAGYALETLNCKKATRGTAHWTKADCARRTRSTTK